MTSEHDKQDNPWEDADHRAVTDDPWHAHGSAEEPPQHSHGETSPGSIAMVGIVSFVLLLAAAGIVYVYFNQVARQKYVDHVERVDLGQSVRTRLAEGEQRLSGYGWVDADEGTVHIPIDLAMDKVREKYASGQ